MATAAAGCLRAAAPPPAVLTPLLALVALVTPVALLALLLLALTGCSPGMQAPAATQAPAPAGQADSQGAAGAGLAGPRWLLQRGTQSLPTGGLVLADGRPFRPQALQGGWTVVFVGFTTCSQVCPSTLALLSAWAQQGDGRGGPAPRLVFSSIDPLNDSPQRLRHYMAGFDPRIAAVTGEPTATDAWASALGAGHAPGEGGIDHSNSLFVIGPDARLAGLLLRPGSAAGLAADLQALQAAWRNNPRGIPGG